jgi:hypothetical protein
MAAGCASPAAAADDLHLARARVTMASMRTSKASSWLGSFSPSSTNSSPTNGSTSARSVAAIPASCRSEGVSHPAASASHARVGTASGGSSPATH